jgi:NADH:ubiquinone oxidoreductase subunit F (NADH-binding)
MSAPQGLPRLLAGFQASGGAMTLGDHEHVHGPLPALAGVELIELVQRSGLRGRGGADFPTAVKLQSVADRKRVSALVVNGSETEPASRKDATLLGRAPHLVLDGALLAARTVGAAEVIVKLGEHATAAIRALEGALAQRPRDRIEIGLSLGPPGYVTGEESAVIQHLNGGPSRPTFTPPRPFERGYRGRPTLIHNPETLAQIALVARHGDQWYRELGTWEDPGSALVTISGAVAHPGVYELAFGTPMVELVAAAGGSTEPLQALLVGGYFGTWVAAKPALALRLAREDLRSIGCTLGAGVVIALGESACGLHESARVINYLAGQSAGQCGPCVYGLAAVAEAFTALADGIAHKRERERLLSLCDEIRGRGACHHPDGAVRFVQSALSVFGDSIGAHRGSRCRARSARLPLATEHAAAARPPAVAGRRRTAVAGRSPIKKAT